jgi:Carboxypeptidase regulatory-like domain
MHRGLPSWGWPRWRSLTWGSLVIAPATLISMTLLPAATAQAVAAGPAASAPAAAGASHVRQVCATPKRGFSACMSLLRTNVATHKGLFPADTAPTGYGPADLQSAYGLPSASAGSGATVAIVDAYDDPAAEADLQTYRAQYGLPVCDTANGCFRKVNQQGQASPLPPPAGGNGWDVEESLDIDMVSAICPHCNILLAEADSNGNSDLYAAEDEAVALGAKYVSNSWAGGEYSTQTQDDKYFDHPGVAITAAAGDAGYAVNYPASSQYVTSVGGTTLTRDSSVARGWTETVWGSSGGGEGTGSGCSAYEPKPAWQADIGCANRTVADVSAVASPSTGLAIYDSYSQGGWLEVGGTSAATPIIASSYALAGQPAPGSNPAQYPYTDPAALNDVTSGANGSCDPAYLCTAGPGYDGPTGLGTPEGVAAFSGGPSGDITGQVTSAGTGGPLANATVTDAQGYTVHTDADGDYALDNVLAGRYDVTASQYGYSSQAQDGVRVTAGKTSTANFTLTALPSVTLSGTVKDGSGHRWPVYSAITITGYPNGPVYTNPYTGAYRVTLPQKSTYQLQVAPVYPGYDDQSLSVKLGTRDTQKNIKVDVDATACTAPGYGWDGSTETFTGWTGGTAQDGWTVTGGEGNGQAWSFSNPGDRAAPPGGDASFAVADSAYYGKGGSQDTSLVSPVQNLSGQATPEVTFDDSYYGHQGQAADLDVSTDGGQDWTTVWQRTTGDTVGSTTVPIPQAAHQADVQVRFHFTGSDGWWWAIDDVFIGSQLCVPRHGGLLAGVTSTSTGAALDGVTVTSKSAPAGTGTSAPTSDPAFPDGFYWLFSSMTGPHTFTATSAGFTPARAGVKITANAVSQHDWVLTAR